MSDILPALIMLAVAVVGGGIFLAVRRRPRKLQTQKFVDSWRELQKLCKDKSTWKQAVIEADNLLDKGLKKKGVRGNGIGERLVKIQRELTDNDGVWYGHKLRRELETNPKKRLKETEVKKALFGIRQALKDIGALPNGQK